MADEVQKLLKSIERVWQEVDTFLVGLSAAQHTELKDAKGWSVKDHLMHMAVWEDGIEALLRGQSRDARMGIDHLSPKPRGLDAINDTIFQQYRGKSLPEVLSARQQIHERLLETLRSLRDEDLARPYRSFAPQSANNQPILGFIRGNTSGHYRKHLPWMKAIVGLE